MHPLHCLENACPPLPCKHCQTLLWSTYLHITAIFLWLLYHALTNNTADNVDDDPDTVTAGDTESEAATPESVAEQAGAAQVSATFLKISNLIPSVSGQPKQGGAQPSCCVASQPATLSEEDGRGESALRAVT